MKSSSRARQLRRDMTPTEVRLWAELRNRHNGLKFCRQLVLGRYIVDFACVEAGLVVEVDGGQHADNVYDVKGDEWLRSEGWQVARYWNHEVAENIAGVVEDIRRRLTARRKVPSPGI